jgi:hypothetical protein
MPKKLLVLIIIFLFVIGGFLFVTFTYSKKSSFPSFSLKKITPTPETASTLTFSPNPLTAPIGATTSANIVLESQGALPKILQLEIEYDPLILTHMSILPANLSDNQAVLLNKINPNTGRISYAIDISRNTTSKGEPQIVATLQFLPLNPLEKNETYINFLPKTTIKGTTEVNTLKAGYGVRVLLKEAPSSLLQKPIISK